MERTLTVVGRGAAVAVPDTAVVRASVAVSRETVAAAWAEVSDLVTRAVRTMSEHLPAGRYAAHEVSLWPQERTVGEQTVRSFEARRGLVGHCPDLEAAGALIDALVAGLDEGLQIEGVSVEVADPLAALERAREAAWLDAERRAEQLADLADGQLGPVLSVEEVADHGGVALKRMVASAPLVPGETELSAALRITWRLVD